MGFSDARQPDEKHVESGLQEVESRKLSDQFLCNGYDLI
jgi:hypothetical protein